MGNRHEQRIVDALAAFTLPNFDDGNWEENFRYFQPLVAGGWESFIRRFGERVFQSSSGTVSLAREYGRARPHDVPTLRLQLRRGHEVLRFQVSAHRPYVFKAD